MARGATRGRGGTINPIAEKLFNYLRDVIYDPAHAELDLQQLPEDFRELGEGLEYFSNSVIETRDLAKALSRGDLNGKLPSPDNEMAAPLKSLHSSLRHLTWQSQQVAKGDYKQRVNFMGEFADAFNSMIEQLDQQRQDLLQEIESGKQKTLDLEQNNNLFEAITAQASQWIAVIGKGTGERLFCNYPVRNILAQDEFEPQLYDQLMRQTNAMEDDTLPYIVGVTLSNIDCVQYFSVLVHPLRWRGMSAAAFSLTDISAEKEHIEELEHVAYRDMLTNVFNRHYGMQKLDQWLEEKTHFILCFIDIDNLKYVNDKFGHTEGDKYIMKVVEVLGTFASDALVCRLGGDEFMLLITGWTQEAAESRLESLRNQLVELTNRPEAFYNHSMSYGVIEVNEHNTTARTDLLSIADEKMYEYKRAHKAQRLN